MLAVTVRMCELSNRSRAVPYDELGGVETIEPTNAPPSEIGPQCYHLLNPKGSGSLVRLIMADKAIVTIKT